MRKYLGVFIVLSLMISCNENLVFSTYESLDNGVWKKGDTISFEWEALDTITKHHYFF